MRQHLFIMLLHLAILGVGGELPIFPVPIATVTPCSGLLFDSALSAQLRGASLLACQPHSGRTHQIRVHCQHVGHPLLGDELYGVQVGHPPSDDPIPCQIGVELK